MSGAGLVVLVALYESAGMVGRLADRVSAWLRFPHDMTLAHFELQRDVVILWALVVGVCRRHAFPPFCCLRAA